MRKERPDTPENSKSHRKALIAKCAIAIGAFIVGVSAERAGVPETVIDDIVDIFTPPKFSEESIPFQVHAGDPIIDVLKTAYEAEDVHPSRLQQAVIDFIERNRGDDVCASSACEHGIIPADTTALVAARVKWD